MQALFFNFIILCCQELLGIQTLVCKLSLSQVHFLSPLEGSIPSTLEALFWLGRMQSLYLKKNIYSNVTPSYLHAAQPSYFCISDP